jgi:hypothetical protein
MANHNSMNPPFCQTLVSNQRKVKEMYKLSFGLGET